MNPGKRGAGLLSTKGFIFTILTGFLIVHPVSGAWANEPLVYTKNIMAVSKHRLQTWAQEKLQTRFDDLEIARSDLNADGMDEFIVKTPLCTSSTEMCTFKILAESPDEMTELGSLEAHALVLGDEYTAGIRNIMAFRDSRFNDYSYELYVWEPAASRYILPEEKSASGP